jgi:AcrR family transcriptional regulator
MASITRRSRASSAEERRTAIEAKLLEATERLLAGDAPYTELSIQQLCSEAGIARSTFYVYFRDKCDLVARLAEEMVGQLAETASKWWQPGASREQALAATREVLEIYSRHESLFAALTETAAYDDEMRALQVEIVERHARPLEELIERGKGVAVREVHTRETVAALSWMLQGSCYHLARGAGTEQLDRLAEATTAIIWHSIYPDSKADTGQPR